MKSAFQLRSLPKGLCVRAYNQDDFTDCMAVYASNRGYTLPENAALMEQHLNDVLLHYLVVEDKDGIIGCGGIEPRAEVNRADLCFGMVHRNHHGQGIGTLLLLARLALVDCAEGETMIFLETSHKTEGFYKRFGFQPVSGYEARYGHGLDYLSLGLWLFPQERDLAFNAVVDDDELQINYEPLNKSEPDL